MSLDFHGDPMVLCNNTILAHSFLLTTYKFAFHFIPMSIKSIWHLLSQTNDSGVITHSTKLSLISKLELREGNQKLFYTLKNRKIKIPGGMRVKV